jgi:hypothetical protein
MSTTHPSGGWSRHSYEGHRYSAKTVFCLTCVPPYFLPSDVVYSSNCRSLTLASCHLPYVFIPLDFHRFRIKFPTLMARNTAGKRLSRVKAVPNTIKSSSVMLMVRLLFGLVRFNQNLKSNRFDDLIGLIWISFKALVITG